MSSVGALRRQLSAILSVAAVLSFVPAVVGADETVAGRVEVGETGYEIPVEITNRSSDTVQGLTVAVVDEPEGLVGFTIDPPAISTLDSGETGTVIVTFDVADDAPVRARAEIKLEVRAAEGFLDNPDPVVVVGVGEDPTEEPEEDEAEEEEGEGAPPVLRLVNLDRRGESREHLSLGTEQQRKGFFSEAEFDEILSTGFSTAPAEIVAGEAFSIKASVMRSVRYADGSFCFRSEPEPDSYSVRTSVRVGGFKAEGRGDVGMSNYCGGNIKTSAEWNTGSRATSYENVFTDETDISMELSPAGVERIERGGKLVELQYRYHVKVSGSCELLDEPSMSETVLIRQRYRTDENGFAISDVPSDSALTVNVSAPSMTNSGAIGVSLTYAPVLAEAPLPQDPIPFEHPDPFPPTPGRSEGGDDGEGPDEGDGTEEEGEDAGVATEDDGTDSGEINPTDPEIAGLIAQWVAVAEPPDNATIGADLRYNEWGQMVGSTPSGTITAVARPDDVGARTSPEYLWGLKGRLDSVDHCTLGEYVEGRVAGSAPTGCIGRYMGEVQELHGRSEGSARAKVEQLKWVAVVMKGDPAPTAELAGTVQRQDPAPATRLPRGQVVQLWLYDEAAQAQVEVPDLAGQSSRMAGAWLDEIGLVAVVQRGGPAPTADLVGKVEAQDPMPGTGLAEGDAVVVRVYADPIAAPPPSVDCSRWPGSVPTTHPTSGELVCDCPSGLRWNRSGTGCEAAVDPDQTVCDRDWPGTVARRNPSNGQLECECPSGLAWDDNSRRCVENVAVGVVPILPDQPSGCAHMPGTIAVRDPRSGRTTCRCSVGAWNAAQNRCVTAALPPLEPRVCIGYYGDIRFAGVTGDPAAAARAESAARAAGCSPEHIAEAISSGTSWGDVSRTVTGGTTGHGGGGDDDSPITPITEPAPDKVEGEANVSSRDVKICIVDVNSVLDDHYHLLVNNRYIGDVANPEGGTTCYNATLNGGSNRLELRLYATRGKNTKLEISLNNGEYSSIFTGETNHIWNVVAP